MAKWIDFTEVNHDHARKTQQWAVTNKERGTIIGYIKWYPAFRQYSFYPNPNTVYERQCLLDIIRFIHNQMLERKLKKKLITG